MTGRGARIDAGTIWQRGERNRLFRVLWRRTIALSDIAKLQDEDIAKHNILLERDAEVGDRLFLIDWDEARINPKSSESQGDEYLYLGHPEQLRSKPLLYTKVQLALLYWDLISDHVDKLKDPITCPGLQQYSTSVRRNDKQSIIQNAKSFVSMAEKEF